MRRRNWRLKLARLVNPQLRAMVVTGISVSARRRQARPMRSSLMKPGTVLPVRVLKKRLKAPALRWTRPAR